MQTSHCTQQYWTVVSSNCDRGQSKLQCRHPGMIRSSIDPLPPFRLAGTSVEVWTGPGANCHPNRQTAVSLIQRQGNNDGRLGLDG